MIVYFCSSCGTTVPEQSLKSGTAVRVGTDTIHCFKCITSRVAKVSDSKVYRALLAKRTEGGLKQAVRRVSQRLISQVPEGRIKRVVKRVSQRLLGYTTGGYGAVTGSNSRNRLPPGTAQTIATVTRRRTEAHNLAVACIACVVLAIGTLIAFLALGRMNKRETAARMEAAKPAVAATAPAAVSQKIPTPPPVKVAHVPAPEPVAQRTQRPAAAPQKPTPAASAVSERTAVIPPLLSERENGAVSTPDFRERLAEDRLNEAKLFRKENPADLAGWQRKLSDIVRGYGRTPAGEEAEKMLAAANAPQIARPANSLDWFGDWQVENLEQRAKAQMYEEFYGEKFVLETYPPSAAEGLRLMRTFKVSGDKPVLEFSVRASQKGSFDFVVEVDGKKTATEAVRGDAWRTFALDLSSKKGSDVKIVLWHAGADEASAFWQAPRFVAKQAQDASLLSVGTAEATAGSKWTNGVDLLALIDPLKDAVAGTWRIQDGLLVSDNSISARIEIPYQPPQEYDLRVRFARVEGSDAVCQILSKSGRAFCWTMGAWNNGIFGFETIAGVSAVANPTTVKRASALENGREYTSLLQVRDDRVSAWLDGKLIAEWKTNFSDMDVYQDWKLRDASLLGIGSQRGQLAVKSIEIVEIKGKGKLVRSDAAMPRVGDIKIEYEKTLLDMYAIAATQGGKAAQARAEQARVTAALAPMSAKLEMDVECFGYAQELRAAALNGAGKLTDNRAYTFTKADGKELHVGGATGSTVRGVSGEFINIDQEMAGARAQVKIALDELSPVTQYNLALLSISQAEAALKQTQASMVRVGAGSNASELWFKDVRRQLEFVQKEPAFSARAAHLLGHAALLEREFQAQSRFKKIEALCKAGNWRDARTQIDEYKADYMNTWALERVQPDFARWGLSIEKETMSPLLKR